MAKQLFEGVSFQAIRFLSCAKPLVVPFAALAEGEKIAGTFRVPLIGVYAHECACYNACGLTSDGNTDRVGWSFCECPFPVARFRFSNRHGGLAQLGERLDGIQKVRGSSPLSSTI